MTGKPRRGKGEGTIYWNKDRNRWTGQLPARPGPGGKRRRGPKVSGKSKREVQQKLADLRRDGYADRRDQTLAAFLVWYCDEYLPGEVKPQTLRSYRQNLVGHVSTLAGHVRIASMDPDDADDLKRWLADTTLKPATQRLAWNQLAAALDVAVSREWMRKNPLRLKSVKPPKPDREQRPILDVDQAQALMDAFRGGDHEALLLTYVLTGARVAEPLALAWSDVDLDAGTLSVGWQLIRRDSGWHREPLKKREAGDTRTIPIVPRLADALRSHRRDQLTEQVAAPTWVNDWDLVFTGPYGQPIWPNTVRRALSTATGRAFGEDGPHITPHRLRAGAASFLLAEHVPIPVVMEILGHRSVQVLMEIYAQAMGVSMDEARGALGRLAGG